jgi:hypothetical protein
MVQHVDGLNAFGVYAADFQNLDGTARNAAWRKTGVAFHTQHEVVGFGQLASWSVRDYWDADRKSTINRMWGVGLSKGAHALRNRLAASV